MNKKDISLLLLVLACVVISRWVPHPPNFSPVIALAIFSGIFFADKRLAFLVPMAVMLASDVVIGFHSIMPFVYIAFVLTVIIGFWVRSNLKMTRITLSILSSSALFFAISNFGVWLVTGMYPWSLTGLIECYVAAIPFFQNTLLGTIFYGFVFIGGYCLARNNHFLTTKPLP